jgi:type II secretory pathway pseudopilin PulG
MSRARGQTGSSLIMIIGVIAALAILAAALVVLIVNVQADSARDRQQTRAFNVTEAALDDALAILAARWPTTLELTPQFSESTFVDRYLADGLAAQYPDLSVQVWFYDDAIGEDASGDSYDTNGDGIVSADDGWTYDMNGNDRIYVEAQATAGDRSSRVRALVMRDTISFQIPRGVAFYTEGDLRTHGGSEVIGIDPGGEPPAGYGVVGYIHDAYTNQGGTSYDPDVTVYAGEFASNPAELSGNVVISPDIPEVESMLDPRILDYLEFMSQPDNYYTDPDDVSDHYMEPTADDPDPDDLTGLVYIESTELAKYQVLGTFNSEDDPGVLIVRGGSLELTGGGEYYGLIYVDGGTTDLGGVVVHGAVICAGGGASELGGSQTISYNDKVWLALNDDITLAAKLVPNTWRELQPIVD